MKIAIFASAFHPSLGGVEELVRQLAHAFQRGGHEAIILTERWPRDLPATQEYEGIAVHRFPFRTLAGASLYVGHRAPCATFWFPSLDNALKSVVFD